MGAPERKAHAAEPRREDPPEDPVQEGEVREQPGGNVVGRGPVRQGGKQGDHPPQQGSAQESAARQGAFEGEQDVTKEAVREDGLFVPRGTESSPRGRVRSSRCSSCGPWSWC